ncbi:DUF1385 domain-containing protein, partial [Candidatus Peregrinibacteria bacterium]|nr:DUF1385 domain-containing protein [Candidatus Peregrinibacteria bacterium]
MNIFKKANFLALTWAIEALNKDVEEEVPQGIDFAVGGQAVIEGVMMRSPSSITIAVRKADGSIKVKKNHHLTLTQRYKWLNIPILRGVVNLFEMMAIGTKAINFSAEESLEEEEPKPKKKKSFKLHPKISKTIDLILFLFSFVFALGLSLFLFKAVPLG